MERTLTLRSAVGLIVGCVADLLDVHISIRLGPLPLPSFLALS